MADVVQKCIDANDIKHGHIVCSVMVNGEKMAENDDHNTVNPTPVADLETKYTTRFDEPTYYSA